MAVVLGVAAAGFLGLKEAGVALTGRIPAGIPTPALPDLSLVRSLWPGALGMALMSFTESIAAGRAFARHDDPPPAPNRELIALGAANLAGSFFQCFPAGGGTSQTAVNSRAGARTQVSALVTAAMVLATLLFLSPLISLLPQATLAAVVVVTTFSLLSTTDFRSILEVRRTEFLWALAACAGVVLLGTLQGILVAVAISLLTLFYQANHPLVYAVRRKPGTDVFRPQSADHPGDETIPGLLIVRTEGRMTFASAPQVRERLRALVDEARPEVVILECSAIPDFEYTALQALTEAEEKLREGGIYVVAERTEPGGAQRGQALAAGQGSGDRAHVLQPSRCSEGLREEREGGTVTRSGLRGNLALPEPTMHSVNAKSIISQLRLNFGVTRDPGTIWRLRRFWGLSSKWTENRIKR